MALTPEIKCPQHQQRQRRPQQLRVDGVEVGKHAVLQRGELIGVNHAHRKAGHAAKQNAHDHAHQQHQMQAAGMAGEQPAHQRHAQGHHQCDLHRKFGQHAHAHHADRAQHQHQHRLQKQIQRIQPHHRRCQDGVVRHGLKHHGGHAQRAGHDHHRYHLGATVLQHKCPVCFDPQRHERQHRQHCHDSQRCQTHTAPLPPSGGLRSYIQILRHAYPCFARRRNKITKNKALPTTPITVPTGTS